MHSLFWGELTIVQECFGFSFLIGKKDPGLYNGCWAWSHCECLDWNDWRGNCEITQAIARSLSARNVTQGCVYTGLVGEERLFLSSGVLEPYMSRKLLEKIPGSETMNRSDRFQTKSHASGTGHLFYRCLRSLPLNWRWKLGQDSEGVAGNGNLKRTMHVKANPNIPFPCPFLQSEPLHSVKFTLWEHDQSRNVVKPNQPWVLTTNTVSLPPAPLPFLFPPSAPQFRVEWTESQKGSGTCARTCRKCVAWVQARYRLAHKHRSHTDVEAECGVAQGIWS